MSKKERSRVPTSAKQEFLQSLGPALAHLPGVSDAEAKAATPEPPVWKPGRVVLRRETAHRGGKVVVVVSDFATHLPLSFIETTARQLRMACGTGGTVKERMIEIQGEQLAKVRSTLAALGFQIAGVR